MDRESTLRSAALLFEIGEIISITPATEGLGNENYFVSTEQEDFVLRILKTQTVEGLKKEVQIEDQLRRVGVRAPTLLTSANGLHWVAVGGEQITASARLAGEHPIQATPEISNAVGVTLAKFHTGVTSIPPNTNSWLRQEEMAEELSCLPNDELGQEIREQLESSVSILSSGLPEGCVHGDLHFGNLVVDSRGDIAIFDFEEAAKTVLILDLAMSAGSIYYSPDSTDPELLGSLFAGYESVRPLTLEERSAFGQAVLYVSGVNAAWLLNRNHTAYTIKTLQAAKRMLAL